MVDVLDPQDGDRCLEPCAGQGHFVDELIRRSTAIHVDAIELHAAEAKNLRGRYGNCDNVTVVQADFLKDQPGPLFCDKYDRIVANPPYGAWQEYSRRADLKQRFPDLYVRETYGLFLAQSLTMLAPNGRAVFILPDTFLYTHLQRALRLRILQSSTIESIDIFPSNLFPGINFAYASLCIISVRSAVPAAGHRIAIRRSGSLSELLGRNGKTHEAIQSDILEHPELTFPLEPLAARTVVPGRQVSSLGDLADCVTGIYSGDDRTYLRRSASNLKYSNRYPAVAQDEIFQFINPALEGIEGNAHFVSLLKGGGYAYVKPELWYLDWSRPAVAHYRTDKKARYQNSSFYFREGIGFPMVSSGRATASIIRPHQLFDQSVVGIFPREGSHFGFVLALMNSAVCWRLLRGINPSTNNSARYVRRLPVVLPSNSELMWFDEVVRKYVRDLIGGTPADSELEFTLSEKISAIYSRAGFE